MEINTKSQFRNKYKKLRAGISKKENDLLSIKLADELLNNFDLTNKNIHLFLTIKQLLEINTQFLIEKLFKLNIKIGTSIYKGFNKIDHVLINEATKYKVGELNIPVPDSLLSVDIGYFDYIIIPLLAYDVQGNRLGYGKGVYDKILSNCKKECIKVGISFFQPETNLPIETHDFQLDFCQTPNQLFTFHK